MFKLNARFAGPLFLCLLVEIGSMISYTYWKIIWREELSDKVRNGR